MFETLADEACRLLSIEPEALAEVEVLFLPERFGKDTKDRPQRDTYDGIALAKEAKHVGVQCRTAFDLGAKPKVLERRGLDIWAGTIWILEQAAVPVIVSVLSAYIASRVLRGTNTGDSSPPQGDPESTIHIEFRIQKHGTITTIQYDGPANDLLAMLNAVKYTDEGKMVR